MTRNQAIEICRKGKKITHMSFSDDEWVEYKDGQFYTEGGYPLGQETDVFWVMRRDGFWEYDWSVYKEKKK